LRILTLDERRVSCDVFQESHQLLSLSLSLSLVCYFSALYIDSRLPEPPFFACLWQLKWLISLGVSTIPSVTAFHPGSANQYETKQKQKYNSQNFCFVLLLIDSSSYTVICYLLLKKKTDLTCTTFVLAVLNTNKRDLNPYLLYRVCAVGNSRATVSLSLSIIEFTEEKERIRSGKGGENRPIKSDWSSISAYRRREKRIEETADAPERKKNHKAEKEKYFNMAAKRDNILYKETDGIFFFLQWISFGLRKTGNVLFLFPVSLSFWLLWVYIYIYTHEHIRKRDRSVSHFKQTGFGRGEKERPPWILYPIRSTSDDRKPDVIIPPKKGNREPLSLYRNHFESVRISWMAYFNIRTKNIYIDINT